MEKTDVSGLQSGRFSSFFREGQTLCSPQAFYGFDDERRPHEKGQYPLLGLTIQRLISNKNTLTGTPKIIFEQISGYFVSHSSQYIQLPRISGFLQQESFPFFFSFLRKVIMNSWI